MTRPTLAAAGHRLLAAVASLILPGVGLVMLGRRLGGAAIMIGVLAGVLLAPWVWFGVWAALGLGLGGALAALVVPRGPTPTPPELWGAVLSRLGLVVAMRLIVNVAWVEPYQIPSGSMFPTLAIGDRVFVSKFDYGARLPLLGAVLGRRSPARGDVIVFRWPRDRSKIFVKRVVAVAGDQVAVRDGMLWVNGATPRTRGPGEPCVFRDWSSLDERWVDRPLTCHAETRDGGRDSYRVAADPVLGLEHDFPGPDAGHAYLVPPGTVFVLGDNRDNALDSRAWGPVPLDLVLGRVRHVWWSKDEHGHGRWSRLGTRIR